jgi:methanogenic corrinoid protein MtbC1
MREEKFMNDAFASIVSSDEVKAIRVLKNAEETGADLVELFTHGYNAGIEHMKDLFCRGEILLPELLSSGKVLKTVAGEIEIRMALSEIKCAGVDYCFFREKGSMSH